MARLALPNFLKCPVSACRGVGKRDARGGYHCDVCQCDYFFEDAPPTVVPRMTYLENQIARVDEMGRRSAAECRELTQTVLDELAADPELKLGDVLVEHNLSTGVFQRYRAEIEGCGKKTTSKEPCRLKQLRKLSEPVEAAAPDEDEEDGDEDEYGLPPAEAVPSESVDSVAGVSVPVTVDLRIRVSVEVVA